MDLILDINVDVYPVIQGEKLAICLATTLNLDGTSMQRGHVDTKSEIYDRSIGVRETLADKYDYVVFGKVFKYRDSTSSGHVKADVYASFGGLLMQLTGDPKRLQDLDLDQSLYLLARKV
jgi:DNA-directed RNA polymerases I, II, and III subunit RPABC3